jgi:hypothetical protein
MLRRAGITGPGSPLTQYALWLLPLTAMFLAFASCATYLSQIYGARVNAPNTRGADLPGWHPAGGRL